VRAAAWQLVAHNGKSPGGPISRRFDSSARLRWGWRAQRKERMKNIKPQLKKAAAAVGATAIGAGSALAQSGGSTFADPGTITSTATTVFTGVATLMVGIVGFWVVLKIVRKIAGK